ncbi:Eco57I restriction-modification methylase domain-containing protein [uncultured Duncaniella sp.]|jgi:type I restriction-modification system DNA methylase subunit|nr:Eco57I restriction-modification methylase domain-containing protein [uncultured Duncaniella sp.]
MEFDKPYSRIEFTRFLKGFLPIDAQLNSHSEVAFFARMNYAVSATMLGRCESLDLNIYEIRHNSKNDARVGLSKDAFRLITDDGVDRALVIFVPEDSNENYRFSLVELTLSWEDDNRTKRTYSNPRRYSYYLGNGVAYYTPNKYLNEPGRIVSVEDLRNRFSVDVLTKAFYNELSDWYAWAIKEIQFPNDIDDPHDNEKYNHEAAIRLITRLIFVWFLKQRKLIPWQFFDEHYIAQNLLDGFTPHEVVNLFGKSKESRYYKAILQNLFFAMLNSPMTAEGSTELTERHFRKLNENGSASRTDFDNNKLMRYEKFFKNPNHFVELANSTVPFLNGGLFDCLDDKENGIYLDAFTDRDKINAQLIIPDYLFFGEDVGKDIDLSEFYGDKNKRKVSARGIIDILKRYNFTVEENTPFDQDVSLDPELLGKVFENLLASYNPETQTTARKQTGSFYTPRDIVQYMVNEALVSHLKRVVGVELEPQYRQLLDYSDEPLNLTKEQRKSILEAVFKCKVLDPACGSGAFPVGMLQQMVHILQRIDPDNEMWRGMILEASLNSMQESMTLSEEERREIQDDVNRNFDESCNNPDYARKLYLIENCIYGVDIQPIAIQISKLRFFISLVIDQKTNNNASENFGIRPLPNLEAKFVAANSLIRLQKRDGNLFDIEDIKADEKLLRIAKHRIFGAKTLRTKRKWKARVAELRQKIADALIKNDFIGNEQAADLVGWDMFDQHKFAPFFDPEWMFGVQVGFDIVIGNPPYIQLQANKGELGKLYEGKGFITFVRTGDIYSLFYEQGWRMLKPDGNLCYITSNKWMRAGYGEKTREFFATKTNPELLIDFAGTKVFDNVTVDTNILLFSKSQNQGKTRCCIVDGISNMSDFVRQSSFIAEFGTSEAWVILTPIEQSIKRKIESVGTPLKDWDIQINYGIKTGFNEAFIISSEKRDEILANCADEQERTRTENLIRPILRGRDIKRYGYKWSGLWLINTHNGVKGKIERIRIEDYPSVKAYLDQFWDKISTRSDKGDTPYNLRNCAYMEDFDKPKIIWGNLNLKPSYALAEGAFYVNAPSPMIVPASKYLLAILNSKVGDYYIRNLGVTRNGGYFEYKPMFVEQLPVPIISEDEQEALEIILSESTQETIDSIIYSLYALSEQEIEFIENQ